MPVLRPVLLFPDPLLKEVCQDVTTVDAQAVQLLTDLADTLYSTPGVGIAAPQIGALVRAIVVDVTWLPPRKGKEPPKGHGKIALLNPRIVKAEGTLTFREGCLSIPEFLADVRRSACVRVVGLDPNGTPTAYESEGFEAVALQHEIDHLDGLLFLDRVSDMKTDLFRRKQPRPT
ncbi:MAG: peptide deformylase [Elusimicrobia bacterium]|nr:peptide deformylase [Elusimicrobiota bacterium]